MTIILFLIDTSGSMNQKANSGAKPTLLDITKETVDRFIKLRQRDVASRGDRYMLLTFEDVPYNIKAGWKEPHNVFMNELKNLTATGLTTIHTALRNSFDYLNLNRMQNGIDFYGLGRFPYFLESAIIILITDGSKYLTNNNVVRDLIIPPSHCPGSEFTIEPFRWDQRLFSIVLRLNGTYKSDANNTVTNVPCDHSPINALCETTGGRSFCVTSKNDIVWSLEYIASRVHNGVIAKFEKFGPDPPMIIEDPEMRNSIEINNRGWQNTRTMILVKISVKGYSVGHWPIPESYCPEVGASIPQIPPRLAHPVIKFTCANSEPTVIENLPFDKYELDPCPLTNYILARKQPNVAWQVFVANSHRNSELGQPFGYLKASTNLTCVNLFVLPYNYPVLLPLLDELFKQLQGKPTREWKQQFDNYLKTIPIYYSMPLRRALQRMNAPPNLVPDAMDITANAFNNTLIKKYKNLAKNEFDKLTSSMGQHKPPNIEWPRVSSSQYNFVFHTRKTISELFCSNPSLQRTFSRRPYEFQDFNGLIVRYQDKLGTENKLSFCKNPVDIPRHDLLNQVMKLKEIFFRKPLSSVKCVDEDQLFNLPVGQMGNYQEYLKKKPAPLKDLEAAPTRQHMFGNPFKLDKKNEMMIDETDIDLVGSNNSGSNGNNNSNNSLPRGMKRSLQDSSPSGPFKVKGRRGPIAKDYVFKSYKSRSPIQAPLPQSSSHNVYNQNQIPSPQPPPFPPSPYNQPHTSSPATGIGGGQTPSPAPSPPANMFYHNPSYSNPIINSNPNMVPRNVAPKFVNVPINNHIKIPIKNGNGNNNQNNNTIKPYPSVAAIQPIAANTIPPMSNCNNSTTIIINNHHQNDNNHNKMMVQNNSNNFNDHLNHQHPNMNKINNNINSMNEAWNPTASQSNITLTPITENALQKGSKHSKWKMMNGGTMPVPQKSYLDPEKGLILTNEEKEKVRIVLHYVRIKDLRNLLKILSTEKTEFGDHLLYQAVRHAQRFKMAPLIEFLSRNFGPRVNRVLELTTTTIYKNNEETKIILT